MKIKISELDALQNVESSVLFDLMLSDIYDPDQLARIMWAFGNVDGGYFDVAEETLEKFVLLSLNRIRDTLLDIHASFDNDAFDPDEIISSSVCQWMQHQGIVCIDVEPDWPWPVTTPPESSKSGGDVYFPNKYSGMYLCGYRVGKTNGLPDAERKRFLDYFFRNQLPSVVEDYHGDAYGDPGSEERLQKIAITLASNCVNFKKQSRTRYRFAIGDYESDLKYLKDKYYKSGMFPWPPIEP